MAWGERGLKRGDDFRRHGRGFQLFARAPLDPVRQTTACGSGKAERGEQFKADPTMQRTMVANLTGIPAMSVPLYRTENDLPIGTQFLGRFGDEATLLKLASQLEQARPWRVRR